MVFAAACLETDRRRPSSEALPGAGGDGPHREVMDGTHILIAAAGQLGGRAVHQRAEASEQEQREVGA